MNARSQRTQAALIEALLSCMNEKPVKDISVMAVSNLAGVDRTTFYRYFKSIDDIVKHLEQQQLRAFRELMESKDLFGEGLINIILDQAEKGKKINQTAMIRYFSEDFTLRLADIAREYAFDAWRSRMRTATDEEVELALTTVISSAMQIMRQAGRYRRETIVRYITNMVNGIVKMYA